MRRHVMAGAILAAAAMALGCGEEAPEVTPEQEQATRQGDEQMRQYMERMQGQFTPPAAPQGPTR